MAEENDVEVKFGADASGVEGAAEEVAAQVGGIREAITALSEQLISMGGVAVAAFERLTLGASSARNQLTELGESAVEVRDQLAEINEALIGFVAYEKVKELVLGMAEAAEASVHMGQTFGISVAEVQQLNAMAALTGVSVNAMGTAITRLDKAVVDAKSGQEKQSEAFQTLGINLNVARTQTELFNTTLEALGSIKDPFERVSLATTVFGKNIKDIGPILGMTQEQLDDIAAKTEEYGAVNTEAAAKGFALAESMNENKVAMQGIGNVFVDALGPALTEIVTDINSLAAAFIESYKEGGTAANTMIYFADCIKAVVQIVDTVFTAIGMFIDLLTGLWNITADVTKNIIAAWTNLKTEAASIWGEIGQIIVLALTGHGDEIQASMAQFAAHGVAAAQAIQNNFKGMGTAVASDSSALYTKLTADVTNYAARAQALMFGRPVKPIPDASQTGNGGPDTSSANATKEKSQMQALEDAKVQLDEEWALSHAGMLRNQAEADKSYWDDLLLGNNLSTNDQMAVQKKYNEAVIALNKQSVAEQIADAKATETQVEASANATLASQKSAIASQIKGVEDAAQQGLISRSDEMARISALVQQQKDDEIIAAQTILQARIADYDVILAHYTEDTVEYKKALADKQTATNAFYNAVLNADTAANKKLTDEARDAAAKQAATWRSNITPIVDSFGSMVTGLVDGTETFKQAWAKVGDSILQVMVTNGERILTNWIMQQLGLETVTATSAATRVATETTAATTTTAVSGASALVRIGNEAAVAAAGAYSAIAAIPFVGPVLAPAAAVAALAAVLALGKSIFSAEGGWGDVPYDGATTQLHKNEMVLPATIASPLRSMLASSDMATAAGMSLAGGAPPSSRTPRGGDTINISTMDGRSIERTLNRDPSMLARVKKKAQKRGYQ